MFAIGSPKDTIRRHFRESDSLLEEAHEVLQDKEKVCIHRVFEGVLMAIQAVAIRVIEAIKYLVKISTQIVFNLIGARYCDVLPLLFEIPGALGAFITPFEIFGRAVGAIFTPKALEGAYLKSLALRPPAPKAPSLPVKSS